MTNDLPILQLQDLVDAVSGTAGALRCWTRLQPAGGAGDKVFPPTYAIVISRQCHALFRLCPTAWSSVCGFGGRVSSSALSRSNAP
jgi:hypothetical protein